MQLELKVRERSMTLQGGRG